MIMDIFIYIDRMKKIQSGILRFVDCKNDVEENYQELIKLFDDERTKSNQHDIKIILYLLLKISNNHYRSSNFFSKIEKILLYFKDEINANFTNSEIFDIFKSNKRILLFLFEEKILDINNSIVQIITSDNYEKSKYPQYFFPEITPFIDEEYTTKLNFQMPNNFNAKRKLGENEEYVWQLIRNDLIDEFKIYVEQTGMDLSSKITESIFETHPFLIKNNPTLIEYSAFFGSIQILKYLYLKKIELTPSLLIFAIHSQNPELIHFLEENQVKPENNSYDKCFEESIKCHHNDLAQYIQANFIENNDDFPIQFLKQSFKNYNFIFIPYKTINKHVFYDLCRYGYFPLVNALLKFKVFDTNIVYSIQKKLTFS